MKMQFIKIPLVCSIAVVAFSVARVEAGLIITSPQFNGTINSANRTLTQSGGNISLINFNSISGRAVFNLDGTIPSGGTNNTNIRAIDIDPGRLDTTIQGVTYRTRVGASGSGGIAQLAADSGATFNTSASNFLAVTRPVMTFDFINTAATPAVLPISAFAFTLNRNPVLVATISVFDKTLQPLDTYTFTTTTGIRFFGYQATGGVANIGRVTVSYGGTVNVGQYGFDDISVVVPEPTSLAAMFCASIGLLARRRRAIQV